MTYLVFASLIQALLIVHAYKKGKDKRWVWAFILLPFVSGIVYLFTVILPDFINARRTKTEGKNYENVVNADFKGISSRIRLNSNFDADVNLAEDYFSKGDFESALELYEKQATGENGYAPVLMFGAAKCYFELHDFAQTRVILDQLIQHNPDYKNPNAHLLYARTLAELEEIEEATHEFETLHEYFTGPKASFYFAQFLKSQGQLDKANVILNEILQKAKASGGHYDLIYYSIIQQVKDELDEA